MNNSRQLEERILEIGIRANIVMWIIFWIVCANILAAELILYHQFYLYELPFESQAPVRIFPREGEVEAVQRRRNNYLLLESTNRK